MRHVGEHVGEDSGKGEGWEGGSSLAAHELTWQLQLGLVCKREGFPQVFLRFPEPENAAHAPLRPCLRSMHCARNPEFYFHKSNCTLCKIVILGEAG